MDTTAMKPARDARWLPVWEYPPNGAKGRLAAAVSNRTRPTTSGSAEANTLAPDLTQLVDEANTRARVAGVSLAFRIDASSGEVVIEVSDRETGELIRRLPPESLAERLARLGDVEGFLMGWEG
jgi:uncharacterized FlaG/YvyC family protein